MTLSRGRVWRPLNGGSVEPVSLVEPSDIRDGMRVAKSVAEAKERAAIIIATAEEAAAKIVTDAKRRAADVVERSVTEGRAQGLVEFMADAIRLRERETREEEAALDRIVDVARLLAERIIGHALSVSPGEIAGLARQALEGARGARSIRIHAHPADAAVLSRVAAEVDPLGRVHAVLPDPSLLPGDLRLETDVGVVDARIGPSLARLATRLREALHP